MPTYPCTQDFEDQANGTTLTTANAGGGTNTNFDAVTIATNSTIKFSTAQAAHGTKSIEIATLTGTTTNKFRWQNTSAISRIGGCAHIYMPDFIAAGTFFPLRWTDNGGISRMQMGLKSTGIVSIQNASFVEVATSSSPIPTDTWVRIEWDITFSASANPQIKLFYSDYNGTSEDELLSPTSVNLGATTAQRVEFGTPAGFVSGIPTFYMDSLEVNETGFTGPVGGGGGTALATCMMMGL